MKILKVLKNKYFTGILSTFIFLSSFSFIIWGLIQYSNYLKEGNLIKEVYLEGDDSEFEIMNVKITKQSPFEVLLLE